MQLSSMTMEKIGERVINVSPRYAASLCASRLQQEPKHGTESVGQDLPVEIGDARHGKLS